MNEDFTQKGKQEALIADLKERLRWYTYAADKNEFDVKEVEAIVNLLRVLEPIEEPEYFNAEKGLERFWKYYEQRQAEEAMLRERFGDDYIPEESYEDLDEDLDEELDKELDAEIIAIFGAVGGVKRSDKGDEKNPYTHTQETGIADLLEYKQMKEKENAEIKRGDRISELAAGQEIVDKGVEDVSENKKGMYKKIHTNKWIKVISGVVITVLVAMVVFCHGTVGTIASQNTGFFHWLFKGESSSEFVVSPLIEVNDSNANANDNEIYENIEDIPEEYRDYYWEPISLSDNTKLEYINITNHIEYVKFLEKYTEIATDACIEVGVIIYQENFIYLHKNEYDGFTYLEDVNINGITMEQFIKNDEDETTYFYCFYSDNMKYYVQGTASFDVLLEVAEEYVQRFIKN